MSAEDVKNAIKDLNDLDDFVKLEAENTIAMNMPDEINILHEEVIKASYHKEVKLAILKILSDLKEESSIDTFIELLHDNNKWVRRESSSTLASYGDKAVPKLIEASNDSDWRARGGIVWALGKIANPDTLDIFIKASEDEKSFVRAGSVFGLGNIGGDQAMEILKDLAENDESGYVKANALTFIENAK